MIFGKKRTDPFFGLRLVARELNCWLAVLLVVGSEELEVLKVSIWEFFGFGLGFEGRRDGWMEGGDWWMEKGGE